MTVLATYEICVDLNHDRDFSDANEDISAYRKQLTWSLGVDSSKEAVARAASLELTLHNEDGRFSPEHASGLSGFQPGALIRVRTTYGGQTRQHFIGWIAPGGIRPAPGTKGRRETTVQAHGWLRRVQDAEAFLPVQEGKRTDEVILELLTASGIYPPGTVGWLLGFGGFGLLGETTNLSEGFSEFTDLDIGATTLNYAGDNWTEGVSAYGALKDVIEAEGEGALLYVDRDGKLVFKSRHWPHSDMTTAVDATFLEGDIKEDGFQYVYGTRILNDVTVSLRPRSVGDSAVTLGTLDNPTRIDPGESRTIRVRYDDGSGNRIGGKDVSMGSWSAKSGREGGTDLTSSVDASLEEGASSAEVSFTNNASQVVYIQAGATVQGIKITDYGEQEITHEDEDSVLTYGRLKEQRSLRLLDDADVAEDFAKGLIYLRKDPTGEIEAITLVANKSDSLMPNALALTIGDRIEIAEGQTGSGGEYHIVGERHEVRNQFEHLVTWVLRPAPTNPFWLLGETEFGELDEAALLGF